jgi:F0F1-type ATP synthase assembly protein I
MVVAILIGVAMGLGLQKLFEAQWLLWVGVGIGIAAAVLNVYKAYSKQYKEFEKLAQDPRYKIKKQLDDEDEDDERSF